MARQIKQSSIYSVFPLQTFPTAIRSILVMISLSLSTAAATEAQLGAPVVRAYVDTEEAPNYDRLLSQYGRNKELPLGFELQALLALRHFPELREVKIRFIVDDVAIPLSSRPYWATLTRSARNRTYLVIIDSNLEGTRDALLLKNQPFNAQVGIIGHELAHTVYYLDRSLVGIIGDAICQLSKCRIDFERDTDRRLVAYGLGWQRYDHALFLRSRFNGNREQALTSEGGGGAYMSPAELLSLIEANELYAATIVPDSVE